MRLAGIIISLAMLIVASEARDRGQFAKSTPEIKAWFDSLKSGKGFLCCSDADGTAVSDVDWESKDGNYRVRLGGQWIDVPDDALVTVRNRAGRTMVWPMPMIEGDTIKIRCFMPGSMAYNRTADRSVASCHRDTTAFQARGQGGGILLGGQRLRFSGIAPLSP